MPGQVEDRGLRDDRLREGTVDGTPQYGQDQQYGQGQQEYREPQQYGEGQQYDQGQQYGQGQSVDHAPEDGLGRADTAPQQQAPRPSPYGDGQFGAEPAEFRQEDEDYLSHENRPRFRAPEDTEDGTVPPEAGEQPRRRSHLIGVHERDVSRRDPPRGNLPLTSLSSSPPVPH